MVPARRCNEGRGVRVFTKSMLTTRGLAVVVHGRMAAASVNAEIKAGGIMLVSSAKAGCWMPKKEIGRRRRVGRQEGI